MKKFITVFLLGFSLFTIAQENYNVIIMPKKFDFLKEENQYNLNVMCKSFFEKEGFKVYYSNEVLPKEIANNNCKALFLDLIENNTVFTTKLKIELKDCQRNVVTFSEQGTSREKNFNTAYNQAIRIALKSLEGTLQLKNTYTANTNDEKSISAEVKEVQPTKEISVPVVKREEVSISNLSLYSMITKNGYNLVDENKNIKIELFKTSNPTIFIAKKGNTQGIFTLNGKNSKFESYQNDVLVVKEVEVKF